MSSTAPSVRDLVPVVPRAELLRFAPAAEERLDWHRRETAYYADAHDLGIPKTTAERVLRGLINTAEYQIGAFSRHDLFDLASGSLHWMAATNEAPPAPKPPVDRTMRTAWARYTTARPWLRPRHA